MKDKVFISSAQKELEAERLALLTLLTTDPFLKDHVEPVLFERIRAAMLDHGLDAHQLDLRDGYFKVILPGPNGDYARLRVPADARGFVPPSVEAQLNDRQKQIMVEVQTKGSVTSGWCLKTLGITYNTAYLDLSGLVQKGLLVQEGKGRATRYRLAAVSK